MIFSNGKKWQIWQALGADRGPHNYWPVAALRKQDFGARKVFDSTASCGCNYPHIYFGKGIGAGGNGTHTKTLKFIETGGRLMQTNGTAKLIAQ